MASGFFLGGAAEGLVAGANVGSTVVRRAQQSRLEGQQLQAQRQKQLQDMATAAVKGTVTNIDAVVKGVSDGNIDPERAKPLITKMATSASRALEHLGQPVPRFLALQLEKVSALATPTERTTTTSEQDALKRQQAVGAGAAPVPGTNIPLFRAEATQVGLGQGIEARGKFAGATGEKPTARQAAELGGAPQPDPGGVMVELENKETGEVKLLRRDNPEVDALAATGKWREAPTRQVSGTPEEFVSKTEAAGFNQAAIASQQAVATIDRMFEQALDTDTFSGLLGKMTQGIDSLLGNFRQLAGVAPGEDALLMDAEYDFGKFTDQAVRSGQLRSNVINLAQTLARAAEPGSRLTNEDVQRQIDRIGGSSGSKEQLIGLLREVRTAVIRDFGIVHKFFKDTEPAPGFFPSPKSEKRRQDVMDELKRRGLTVQ